ncbi:unnamed protein product, partial [Ceratitis capitata]
MGDFINYLASLLYEGDGRGCCVCSDERGWPENPLVYCDERSARVRCELCPSRDGALKKTIIKDGLIVVCALYIPEVRFGNVTTMEPIILQLIRRSGMLNLVISARKSVKSSTASKQSNSSSSYSSAAAAAASSSGFGSSLHGSNFSNSNTGSGNSLGGSG